MIALPDVFVEHEGIYLLSHSIGLPARGARDAAADYFEVWESDTSQAWPQWLGAIDGFREALSRLIGGQPARGLPEAIDRPEPLGARRRRVRLPDRKVVSGSVPGPARWKPNRVAQQVDPLVVDEDVRQRDHVRSVARNVARS